MKIARNLVIALLAFAPAAGEDPPNITVTIGREWNHQWNVESPEGVTVLDMIATLGGYSFKPYVAIVARGDVCCVLDAKRSEPIGRVRLRDGDTVLKPESDGEIGTIEAHFGKILRGTEAIDFLLSPAPLTPPLDAVPSPSSATATGGVKGPWWLWIASASALLAFAGWISWRRGTPPRP